MKPFLTFKEFPSLIEVFVNEQDIAETTRKVYSRGVKYFFNWLWVKYPTQKGLLTPKAGDCVQYKADLIDRDYSPHTIESYMTSVQKFFKWAAESDIYPNIAKNIKHTKRPKGFAKIPLTADQVRLLINSISGNSIIDLRDLCIIRLMIENGLRAIEISRLSIQDFEEANNSILIHSKGAKKPQDIGFITEKTKAAVVKYLKKTNCYPDAKKPKAAKSKSKEQKFLNLITEKPARLKLSEREPMFKTMHRARKQANRLSPTDVSIIIAKRLQAAGLKAEGISGHSLRHTCAALLVKDKKDLLLIKNHMRHKSYAVTEIYTAYIEKELLKQQKTAETIQKIIDI